MPKKRSEEADPLRIYMDEIGAIPLLTPREEIDLADRIASGEKEESLKARNELVRRNLRLVVTIARSKFWGISLQDRIQEGNKGLMRAADKFDPRTFGTKFDTYAKYWIERGIRRGIAKQRRTVYIPPIAAARYREWLAVRKRLKAETGFTPTFLETAAAMNITHPNGLSELREIVEGVKHVRRGHSFHRSVSGTDDRTLGEVLPAADSRPDAPSLARATAFHRSQVLKHVKHLISALPKPDEREVLEHRYFAGTDEPVSFTQLAKENGNVTRQAMQQREGRALKVLREGAKTAVQDALLAGII